MCSLQKNDCKKESKLVSSSLSEVSLTPIITLLGIDDSLKELH